MSFNLVVPDLAESVVEATVSSWTKKVGDKVSAGEVIVVLETDKVSLEVTAEGDGVLESILTPEGTDVEVGAVLGVVSGSASATTSQVITPISVPAPVTSEAQKATPVAKRVATEHSVDIAQVPSSGTKVTKSDVQNFISGQNAPAPVSTPKPVSAPKPAPSVAVNDGGGYRKEERVKMSRRRQTIAKRLIEAQSTAALLTTFNEIDMTAVNQLRARRKDLFKEKHGVGLGFNAFFVKAVIGALKVFPQLNAEIQENEIVYKHYYDIGIAIGMSDGLVVPVLRDADRMSFAQIENQVKDYAKQAQDGSLGIESLIGGTFTITNGGIFGSLMSTPILNPPQVGILGLHAIKDRAVVVNGEIVVRPMMYVALTYDHRMVDGREAVQFLVKVKDLIEDPEVLLIEG
ncbi:MAG: 2-oxoglutarate dehydrogenase complex dihydrolipoyllysine-residue succinyltransferase [Phototrophicales bacterium]|nr:2-oxoglutarate dehydrogenase complex dihydrolipoyllysine-residue succinyltransferase [Phototrophicales bacterium]